MSAPLSTQAGPSQVAPRAGLALALLLGINLFNYIDRFVLSAVVPMLKVDASLFSPSDPLLHSKIGMLSTAFMFAYMLTSPVFAWLGDRGRRWPLIGLGVILWSLASGGTGLAIGFGMLLATRCLVGIGEAAYGPVAPSMLSDLYPQSRRGQIMSFFYMAIPVGSALGVVLGGQVAHHFGWRWAFYVVVPPGLLLGGLCFLMREPPRIADANSAQVSFKSALLHLIRIRSLVYCTLGMTCTTFFLGGVIYWAPTYILERESRFQVTPEAIAAITKKKTSNGDPVVPPEVTDKLSALAGPEMTFAELREGLKATIGPEASDQYLEPIRDLTVTPQSWSVGQIALVFGAITVVSGFLATMLGGWLGDRLRGRVKGAYFIVCGYTTIASFPCFVAALFVPLPYFWVFIFLAVFGLFMNTGPANAILANVSPSRLRGRAFALNILVIHMLGDAISPFLIGLGTDLSSLQLSLAVVSVFIVLGGLIWVRGAKYLDEDTAAISRAESEAIKS